MDYFIKPGYKENTVQTYNSDNIEKYWTKHRIAESNSFQYHVYSLAKRIFTKNNLSSVIDIGCGPASKVKFFFKGLNANITIVDQPSVGRIVANEFPSAHFIGHNLEVPLMTKDVFDMIIFSDVIEHLERPELILMSMKSIIKKDGFIVLSTPERDLVRGTGNIFSPNTQHVREWSRKELNEFITSLGFRIEKHILLPQRRLSYIENVRYQILNKMRKCSDPMLFGCQTMILRNS